ncbi:MAG TPA: thioredoxin family protein [Deltaproteobacteria bacterium]|nr:thioredoxin family protein [Deltaproteobacteria bacterium]HOM30320.1 thioredoxin family protein [Deltaproteobacteria bacterium]HPP81143.1 thioredoxin family protein [Deltaproteobacteria bacterium]
MAYRMHIEVTGPGCPFCKTLYKWVKEVVGEKGIDADVEHVTQLKVVMRRFPFTPALEVDGEVVHRGKWLPNKEKIHALITRGKAS